MGERAVVTIVIVALVCGTVMISSLAKYWFNRARAVGSKELTEILERLSEIERSVDAIAVETERISEGQRFTAKVLSERAPSRSVAP
jgi:hypothetical protein